MGVTIRQKTKAGPWWVFVNHHGKRTSKMIGDKVQAKARAKELKEALDRGDLGLLLDAPPPSLTFGEYAERFLKATAHELKASTWEDYDGCIRRQLKPQLGSKPLADIRARDVKEFEASLRGAGFKPLNVRKHVRILSSILTAAVEDDELAANPARNRRRRRHSKDVATATPRHEPPSRAEIETLLATAHTHEIKRKKVTVNPYRPHRHLLLLLARTGLRLGEAFGLEWGDVDWRRRRLHVQRAYVRERIDVTKSGKERWVDLSDQLYDDLLGLYRERLGNVVGITAEAEQTLEVERGAALGTPVFADAEGQRIEVNNFRRHVWKPLLTAAKLRHFRIHDLRHACASILIESGAELQYVQAQLGHATAAFTLTVYGHLLPKDRRGVVNLLDVAPPDTAPARTPGARETEKGAVAASA